MDLTQAVFVIVAFFLGIVLTWLQGAASAMRTKFTAEMSESQLRMVEMVVREAVLLAQQIGVRDALTNEGKKFLALSHAQAELDRLGIPIDLEVLGNKIEAEVGSTHWAKIFGLKVGELEVQTVRQ